MKDENASRATVMGVKVDHTSSFAVAYSSCNSSTAASAAELLAA